jgi:hypothetical protein
VIVPPRREWIGQLNLEHDISVSVFHDAPSKARDKLVELSSLQPSAEPVRRDGPRDSLEHQTPPIAL